VEERYFEPFKSLLENSGNSKLANRRFKNMLDIFFKDTAGCVDWNLLKPLTKDDKDLVEHKMIEQESYYDVGIKDLDQLAILKLNGGLGTSMGCTGPKSCVQVTPTETFLSIFLKQILNACDEFKIKIPVIFLNSYYTIDETKNIIKQVAGADNLDIHHIIQSRFPRIKKEKADNGLYYPLSDDYGEGRFYPPGHGDVYDTICNSGLIDQLIEQGKRFLFISNSDNLGAVFDPYILGYMTQNKTQFIMEVTKRTENDRKGGTLIYYPGSDGQLRLKLLEIAQVDPDHNAEFQSINKFSVFNTNSIWLDLHALKQKMEDEKLHMDVIVNPKVVEQEKVVQLEIAMGSAISAFDRSVGVLVPRTRFFPVKNTNDLFLLRSNLFQFINNQFILSSIGKDILEKSGVLPVITLGPYHKKVDDFEKRLPNIPDISELNSLVIKGNIFVGQRVKLMGNVVIEGEDEAVSIPDDTILSTGKYTAGDFQV